MHPYYYITVLSNWLPGYDRYRRVYSKAKIPQSTYPGQFYLLSQECDPNIGMDKAQRLLHNLGISGNEIIRIETRLGRDAVRKNVRNGLGWVVDRSFIEVAQVYRHSSGGWAPCAPEDLTALSFRLQHTQLKDYASLIPRSLSFLPVAHACQARCWFCFSSASLSAAQRPQALDLQALETVCAFAKSRGAERFVLTGGGEPGLLAWDDLVRTLETARKHFAKVVMISNGLFLSRHAEPSRALAALEAAGLTTLCLSRHAPDDARNRQIMGVDLGTEAVLAELGHTGLQPRLVCVLQKMGVHDLESISDYLDYAARHRVSQVCFKELYIASTHESLYGHASTYRASEHGQVPLKVVLEALPLLGFRKVAELPWGSPVFVGDWPGANGCAMRLQVAAYTEPSVGWERYHGIARSYNLMADGKCYATLEDPHSEVRIT